MSIINHPPKWADKFLEWYCRPELLEEIQGDVYELFDSRIQSDGLKMARWRFIWDVLRSFRLSTIKNINLNFSPDMLKSNLKIAWRQLLKQKMYSVVKIGGFALGIAACLLIALFIKDEMSYDQHYANKDQIYRVVFQFDNDGEILKGIHAPAPFAKAMKEDYPEIQQVGRILDSELFGTGSKEVRRPDQTLNSYEEKFIYFDQSLLEILEIPIIDGNPKEALSQPNTLVISKSKADKYFPNESPIGQSFILNNNEAEPFIIGGVMEDLPANMHFQADYFMTLSGVDFYPGEQENWLANNYHTYLLINEKADIAQLENKMRGILDKYVIPTSLEAGMVDAEEYASSIKFELQAVEDIHLYSDDVHDGLQHGDIRFVWLFGGVALFILLIACINFINLSTARSANRAKEVGLRKVVGSFRAQIIQQFLTESVLYSALSFGLGGFLAYWLLPYFNYLADKSIVFPTTEWWLAPILLVATLMVGFLAGLYPAFYLSSFRPAMVLKGKLSQGSKSSPTRNSLVIFQFTTSIILIISTLVIYQQMNFILNKKVGFDKDHVILLEGANTMGDKIKTLKDALINLPEVEAATVSDYLPVAGTMRNGNGFWKEGKVEEESAASGQMWRVDHDYIKTMGMKIVQGRDFSIEMPTDSQALIINQTLADELGFEDPIGQRITNSRLIGEVIGVVEDFHFESMKEDIRGLCMAIGDRPAILSVKVNGANMQAFFPKATQLWDEFSPNQPIRYTFLDQSFANMYSDVKRLGGIFTTFTMLAIIIACLGLFALSAYMAEQRRKEIGIRKVLGASMQSIIQLLTKNFLRLVFVSLLIAIPAGWYLMRKWLQDYSYRIDLSWDVFALSGLIVLLIALITISVQAIKTANVNPVESLRSE